MDLESVIQSEVSQKEKNKYFMLTHMYGIYNMAQMNLSTKQKQTHRHRDQTCGFRGQGGRGMDWEFGVGRCKLLHLEWINDKVLLYSTGKYIQSPGINHNGKEY